ncbi:MAG: AAA family ATPase [Pseudanabaena sp.]
MFTEVQIENYKSIQSLKINLGRVNVFIGENGCGKSNILEAIALAGAAAGNKLDNEFLAPRGIRVTEPKFMRSAFDKENITKEIKVKLREIEETVLNFIIQHDNQTYSNWTSINGTPIEDQEIVNILKDIENELYFPVVVQIITILNIQPKGNKKGGVIYDNNWLDEYAKIRLLNIPIIYPNSKQISSNIENFLIYSPENSLLRIFEEEGQVQPLGTKGEGLLKLLETLNYDQRKIDEIKQRLKLIDWFDNFYIPISDIERIIEIKDRYLAEKLPYFTPRSSNEGFLFLMFYFTLFVSCNTPQFFAIDNIENALNPKLCTKLIQELVELAKKYDKQVIFTTHNPAILDGLDLNDDEQRLFVIYRNMDGHTKARRIYAPEPLEDDEPLRLSEAFINGYIGGLPKNF